MSQVDLLDDVIFLIAIVYLNKNIVRSLLYGGK